MPQNVSGNVQDYFFNVPIEEVAVILKSNLDGGVLGTDSTDASGNFSIDYVIVGVDDNKSIPQGYYLSNPYPQPFNPSAKFDFNNPRSGSFDVRIYNIIGQLLYEKNYSIETGRHSIIVSGLGSAGVYLFNISGKDFSKTQKLVLLDGGSRNINVELTAGKNSDLKKINMGDLLIEFRKPGYIDKDTVLVWDMNLTVNTKLNLIAQTVNASYNVHVSNLQTGENVPDATVSVKDQGQNLLFSVVTDTNGNAVKNYQVNYYSNGVDTLWDVTQLNSTLSKTGYNPITFSNDFQAQLNFDKQLDKIPYEVNFSLNPWNILGFQITDVVMQTIGQDSIRTHSVDTDGKLHFNYNIYNDVVIKDIQLIHLNNNYNPYLTIRRVNQTPDQLNLFENSISGVGGYTALPDTLIINLDVMNSQGNANIFFDPSQVYHPYWGYVNTMSDTIRSYFECGYPGKLGTTRWKTINTPDSSVKIFNWRWEENSGDPVPPDQMAQTQAILDTILSYTIHPSGDVLMYYERFTIDSLQDPNWINATQLPISNLIYTRHDNVPTPGNFVSVNPTTGFSKYGHSLYAPGSASILKADEILSSFTAEDDNIHGNSVGSYAFTSQNGEVSITEAGKYLIYKMWMSNPKRRHK